MKTFARAGVTIGIALALTLAAHAAFAIEYDDVIQYTKQGVSDRAIVELIVKDGRAFKMSSDERNQLRDAGVSEIVIRSMNDPTYGEDWLQGKVETPDGYGGANDGRDDAVDEGQVDDGGPLDQGNADQTTPGVDEDGIPTAGDAYSTSLDQQYGNGWSAGYADGHTALVFSFGYYYGPLARYYYNDPFYYTFWYHGYQPSYWPSYYAYWWRPANDWCYAYPYNYFNYDSYYCDTYYDPGYYEHRGYHVMPGYGRTVWDNGPRWRNGGTPPSGGGRPAPPPVIRDAVAQGSPWTGLGDRVRQTTAPGARGPGLRDLPISRTPIEPSRGTQRGVQDRGAIGRGPVVRGTPPSGERTRRTWGDFLRTREPAQRTQPAERGDGPRILRGSRGSYRREVPSYGDGGGARTYVRPQPQPAPAAPAPREAPRGETKRSEPAPREEHARGGSQGIGDRLTHHDDGTRGR